MTLLALAPFLLSAALTAATGAFVWTRRGAVPGGRTFAAILACETLWTALHVGELLAGTPVSKFLWDRLQYVPMAALGPLALAFALRYTGRSIAHAWAPWLLAAAVPLPALATGLLEALGGAAARPLRVDDAPPFGALVYPLRASDTILIGWTVLHAFAATGVLLSAFTRQRRAHRAGIAVVASALVLPAAGALVALLLGLRYLGQRDVTPALFGAAAALTAWGLVSRRFLDLAPVPKDRVLEHLPDALLVVDGQDRIAEANRAAARLLSVPIEAAIGRRAADVVPAWAELSRAAAAGAAAHVDLGGVAYDVRTAPMGTGDPRARAIVLRDVTSVHRANVALLASREELERGVAERTRELMETNEWLQREVTEHAAAEVAAREAARRLQALFDNAFQLIGMLDHEGRVLSVNRTALELVGADAAAVQGLPLPETPWWAHDPAGQARLRDALREAAGGRFVRLEATHRAKDGSLREIDFSLEPVRDAGGAVYLLVAEGRDITALREAERARRRLESRLEEGERLEAMGRLAGGVGHEFNNLLTTVLANAKIAREEVPPGSELREMLDDLTAAAEGAAGLTRQLLAYGRRQPPAAETLALDAAVDRARGLLAPLLGEDVALAIDVPAGLALRADAAQLEQVLVQLAVRARDAMRGRGTFAIRARARAGGDGAPAGEAPGWVVLTVSDTGAPLPPDALRNVFEPFATRGGGLGLALVHRIVHAHGGFIDVAAAEGGGTRFDVYLPRVEGAAAAPAPARAEGEPAAAASGERVMVVEDQEPVRSATVRILGKLGYHVRAFATARDALRALDAGEPVDLLVTDVRMPDMSGPELVRAARARWPALRALYVSGALDPDGVDLGRGAAAPFLPKPFTPASLAEAVRGALATGPLGGALAPATPE